MQTTIKQKPLVLPWMSLADRKFREEFPKIIEKLPEHSFLDKKSFKVEGYFIGDNIGSVVLKIKDKNGTYVVRSMLESKRLITEAVFLQEWQKVGGNVIQVLQLVKPVKDFPITVEILEYIPTSTTDEVLEKSKDTKSKIAVYKKLGQGLAILHRAKGKGYGDVINLKGFKGRYPTFRKEIESYHIDKQKKTLLAHKLLKETDLPLVEYAIEIVERDIKRGTRPSLIHNDPALFNTFGVASIKFFDPHPKITHPLQDLALALIWTSLEKDYKHMSEALVVGYRMEAKYDELVLQACIFLRVLGKWEWWLERGKKEKVALGWIKRTKGIFEEAKRQLTA